MGDTRNHIQHLEVEEALRSLHTTRQGLAEPEAERRLGEFGPNALERLPRESLHLRLLRQFVHFFAILLWAAAGLAFLAQWKDPASGMSSLGFAIIGVIIINGLFSFWQEHKAEKALEALQDLLPPRVKVVREGRTRMRPNLEVVPGDLLVLEEGDAVPADCRVIEARGLRADIATVTGESLPKAMDANPTTEESLLRARNILLAGTSVVSGHALALVFATGMHTEFGTIARLTQQVDKGASPLQRQVAKLSRWIGLLSVCLGLLFFALGGWLGLPLVGNLLFSIGVIVANVPEGLLPTVTLALAMGAQRLARKRALVRHLPAVETLGSATVICTDKTGTLTQNRMEVRRILSRGRECSPEDLAHDSGLAEGCRHLLEGARLCHDLKPLGDSDRDGWAGDPMEIALATMGGRALQGFTAPPLEDELPFDTDRKRMSTLHRTPEGLHLYTKGAPETLLELCSEIEVEGGTAPLTAERKATLSSSQQRMAARGLRVLAFAHRKVEEGWSPVHLEEGMVLSGLVGLEDPPRPEVAEAMATCHRAGIRIVMITGDHPATALAIAREIGMVRSREPAVVLGDELRRLSDTQLQLKLEAPELIFARMGAEQKLRIVEALQRKGHVVAVTGDGVNDAPALRRADIGIAMGLSGTDVAKEAADLVLLDDHFATIVLAIEEGRAVFENVQKFLTYHMSSNVAELAPYLAFALFKLPLGLTVIQILMVDLSTDMVPALGLGAEPPAPGAMARPPYGREYPILTPGLVLRTYLWLGALEAVAGMTGFLHVLRNGGWRPGQVLAWNAPLYLQATTACLAGIILVQMMNVFLCRHPVASVFTFAWTGNRLLLTGVGLEVLLLGLYTYSPLAHRLIGTAAFPASTWWLLLPFPFALLLLEEGRKALVRRIGT